MQLFSYFLFFVVIWWVLFFIFLPIKNETSTEWQKGNANSAPTKSYLLKVIITTILSFIILITLIYFDINLAFIFNK